MEVPGAVREAMAEGEAEDPGAVRAALSEHGDFRYPPRRAHHMRGDMRASQILGVTDWCLYGRLWEGWCSL